MTEVTGSWFISMRQPLAVDVEEGAAAVPEEAQIMWDGHCLLPMRGEKFGNLFQLPVDSAVKSSHHALMTKQKPTATISSEEF